MVFWLSPLHLLQHSNRLNDDTGTKRCGSGWMGTRDGVLTLGADSWISGTGWDGVGAGFVYPRSLHAAVHWVRIGSTPGELNGVTRSNLDAVSADEETRVWWWYSPGDGDGVIRTSLFIH